MVKSIVRGLIQDMSVIRGKVLSGEALVEKGSLTMFLKDCNSGTIPCVERKSIQEGWGTMAKEV